MHDQAHALNKAQSVDDARILFVVELFFLRQNAMQLSYIEAVKTSDICVLEGVGRERKAATAKCFSSELSPHDFYIMKGKVFTRKWSGRKSRGVFGVYCSIRTKHPTRRAREIGSNGERKRDTERDK